jgi:hypothetical protein
MMSLMSSDDRVENGVSETGREEKGVVVDAGFAAPPRIWRRFHCIERRLGALRT